MIGESTQKYLTGLKARYEASRIPAFLEWWGGELAGLVPESLKGRLMPPKPEVWIVPAATGGGDLRIWTPGEVPQVLDVFGAGEDVNLLRGRWQDVLASFTDGKPEVRLCLNTDDFLSLEVNLPAAVEGELRQTLTWQIDQLTPFRADQVWFDFQLARRDVEHQRLDVALRVVPKAALNPLNERLRAIGIAPHRIDTLAGGDERPEPEGFNLLPEDQRPRYVHARARLNWGLAGAVVVVLGLVMAQTLYLRGQTVEILRAEADALRAEARSVMELQQRLDEALQAANFLAERRREQPVSIEILAEITELLPNDIWLQQLRMQGDELTIQGLTQGSQRVIELLNQSPRLSDAEFRGSISMDQASGRERFQATARVLNGPPRAAPEQTEAGDSSPGVDDATASRP